MNFGRTAARSAACGAIVLIALAARGCKPAGPNKAFKTVRIYDLLAAVPDATPHVHTAKYLQVGDHAVADETRGAILLHPTGNVDFPAVHLSSNAVLAFWIGVDNQVWDKAGDGVEFTVFVSRANGARTKVYSRYLDPKHNPDDRRWVDGRVSLKAFRNEDVHIIFATGPGPSNDFNFDWGLWAEPEVILADDADSGTP
jgi:hypothetical protein